MVSVGELKEEISQIGAALEAGERGPAIGGEVLVAFAAAFIPVAVTMVTSAYGILSPYAYVAPAAGLAGFVAFLTLARGSRMGVRLSVAFAAAIVGQLLWLALLQGFLTTVEATSRPVTMLFAAAFPLGMLALTLAGTALAVARLRSSTGARTPANRAIIACWLAIIGALAVLVASFTITGFVLNNFFGFMLFPGIVLALWGAGWAASGWISGRKWMGLVALGSCALALYHAASMDMYGSLIVALALLVLAPGIKLLRVAGKTDEA